jgi:hypothetical protein
MFSLSPRPKIRADRKQLRLESLEPRQMMSATMITDMTQWAQQFPRHSGPTVLNLNFDGKKVYDEPGMRPYSTWNFFPGLQAYIPITTQNSYT